MQVPYVAYTSDKERKSVCGLSFDSIKYKIVHSILLRKYVYFS